MNDILRRDELRVVVLGSAIAAAVVGCGGGGEGGESHALTVVGEPQQVCVPAADDGLATVALDTVKNESDSTIVMSDLSPVGSRGITVAGAYVVEHDGGPREVASGFTAPEPSSTLSVGPGEQVTIGLGLRIDAGKEGRADAVRITFHDADDPRRDRGEVVTVTSLVVLPAGEVCQQTP